MELPSGCSWLPSPAARRAQGPSGRHLQKPVLTQSLELHPRRSSGRRSLFFIQRGGTECPTGGPWNQNEVPPGDGCGDRRCLHAARQPLEPGVFMRLWRVNWHLFCCLMSHNCANSVKSRLAQCCWCIHSSWPFSSAQAITEDPLLPETSSGRRCGQVALPGRAAPEVSI